MLLIFSGPSAVGKDTIWLKEAEYIGFKRRMMYTTREKRPNEIVGYDYNFISKQKFKEMISLNKFIEWDYYFSNYYGIIKTIQIDSESENIVMHSVAKMAFRVRKKVSNLHIVSLVPGDTNVLFERLQRRGCDTEEMILRKHHIAEEIDNSFLADTIINHAEDIKALDARKMLQKILKKQPITMIKAEQII